jgi:glycosyltransferase involved in cell wall biosynthesis
VDLFIAPSPSIAAEYETLGIQKAKIRISDYGFPLVPNREPRRPRRPLLIGYVGTLVWHKGVHVLLAAARLLGSAGYELHVYGDVHVDPGYARSLERGAVGLPVFLHGGFEREALAQVFDSFDVLVVPSIWLENSPLVVHEAFMFGVPVVGSRIGGTADLIQDGVNGFLYDPESADQLAGVLRQLIEAPERLAALVRHAPPLRSLEEDARGWEAIYEAAIAPRDFV